MTAVVSLIEVRLSNQPDDTRLLPDQERDRLIISAVQVDGVWVVKSHYGEDKWYLTGGTTNRPKNCSAIDFTRIPAAYRGVVKAAMYRYLRRGREGPVRPATSSMAGLFNRLMPFLRHLDSLKLKHIGAVTPLVCSTYVAACKAESVKRIKGDKPLSSGMLRLRFQAVEWLHELSQYTATPIPSHPWPESSAMYLAGETNRGRRCKTPLIPDDVFTALFQAAYALMQRGMELLDLRDALDEIEAIRTGNGLKWHLGPKNRYLEVQGWKGGLKAFNDTLVELRTACYIVVASLSGCRNHELAYVQTGACYRTEGDDGEIYWWMRSQSDKTGASKTEWMVPEAAVEALRVMDRWAVPYQSLITEEIAQRRSDNPTDPEIAEALKHANAVFLGLCSHKGNQVRTLSDGSWRASLNAFVKRCGLDWNLATHHFRRKFANYAARSQFGDLRYLREHFKHWSQDMTNDGYALNESQEMELYAEIAEELDAIKLGLTEQWLSPDEPLAGGYGKNLMDWRTRRESVAIFKDHKSMVASVAESHAIRSNGHAWCTADDNKCIGNTFEKTRCSGCDNAVIGRFHARIYQNLYEDLKTLAECNDIGPGGQVRVLRDLDRCRDVLVSLGYDPEAKKAV